MRIFVTGAAGFVGFHLARRLLNDGHEVLGYDGVTSYYDVGLKRDRLALLEGNGFSFVEAMLEDRAQLDTALAAFAPNIVVHLAAQAGVRHSLTHPEDYVSANVTGTLNLLEAVRARPPRHLLMASSSSVYGANIGRPFRETDRTDFPLSTYAATKKSGEALSHTYAQLYRVPVTLFRFFTVYGPWGRPDMALFRFAEAISKDEPIEIYGEGRMSRDFTYIDDLVEAVIRLIDVVPEAGKNATPEDSISPVAPWRVVNIAGGAPTELLDFVDSIERAMDAPAKRVMKPVQPGDAIATWADPSLLQALTGYLPKTPVDQGVAAFVDWHKKWNKTAL